MKKIWTFITDQGKVYKGEDYGPPPQNEKKPVQTGFPPEIYESPTQQQKIANERRT